MNALIDIIWFLGEVAAAWLVIFAIIKIVDHCVSARNR